MLFFFVDVGLSLIRRPVIQKVQMTCRSVGSRVRREANDLFATLHPNRRLCFAYSLIYIL